MLKWVGRGVLIAAACAVGVSALPETADAVLSGTNGNIVFVSGRGTPSDNGNAKLYLRRTFSGTGGSAIPATAPPLDTTAGQHRHPTWSPDRTQIAYARGGSGGCTPQCDIYTLDLTDPNANPVPVTNTAGTTEDRPAWSPDGTRIAFESGANGGGQSDILVDTQPFGSGTNLTLANAATPEGKPAWTPDSETLYYHRENRLVSMAPGINENETANIYREPANNSGSPALAVPVTSGAHTMQPSISPDGTKLCYTSIPSAGFFNPMASVWVANLTPASVGSPIAGSGIGDYNCTWSPDGTQVAYAQGFGDPGSLIMRNLNNPTLAIPLEESNGWDGNPDWAPDGRPTCDDTTVDTQVNTPVQIEVPCTDSGPQYERTDVGVGVDPDGNPASGTVDIPLGLSTTATYTPNQGFSGTDSFTVKVRDELAFGSDRATVTVNVQPQGPGGGGDNDFTFGKVKKNARKGTAKLTVNVPGAGDVDLAKSKKVKGAEKRATSEGSVKLAVKPKGKAKEKLADTGKAKVKAEVTYTPDGGDPSTKSKRVKLKLK
jgi:Tol biopolymer transport system component